jgi:protein TonB
MKTSARTAALSIIVLASLCGCGTVVTVASTAVDAAASGVSYLAKAVMPSSKKAETAQPSPTLDAYKTTVAQHVVRHNPEQAVSGKLPPMLPAIVVLDVTVGKNGDLRNVSVRRGPHDPDTSREASQVAVASMRRSEPLPAPVELLANNSDAVTYSETFLFVDSEYHFQLRSLAPVQ